MLKFGHRMVGLGALVALLFVGLHAPVAAAPTQTEIRLITPVLTKENSFQNYDGPGYWVSQGWFPDGITYRQTYAPIGSTIHLTWLVTDPATKSPLANTVVTLRVNKGYSVSNAKVKIGNSMVTTGVERTGIDQLRVTGTTDEHGYVTFELTDMDDPKDGAEPQPSKFNQQAKTSGDNPMGDPNIALFTQIKPEILGEKNDIADFVEFHFYKPNAPAMPDLTSAKVAALVPTFTAENSSKKDSVLQKYSSSGRPLVMVFGVTDAKGTAISGTDIEIATNPAGSGAVAAVGIGAAAPTAAASKWTGKTDAFGNFAVVLTNTVTKGEPKPTQLNALPPAAGAVFARLQALLPGVSGAVSDSIDVHFYQAAAPTPTPTLTAKKVTITCAKGKSTKKVTAVKPVCPKGYKRIK